MRKIASMVAAISMIGFFSSFSLGVENSGQDDYMVDWECPCKNKKKKPKVLPPPPPPKTI